MSQKEYSNIYSIKELSLICETTTGTIKQLHKAELFPVRTLYSFNELIDLKFLLAFKNTGISNQVILKYIEYVLINYWSPSKWSGDWAIYEKSFNSAVNWLANELNGRISNSKLLTFDYLINDLKASVYYDYNKALDMNIVSEYFFGKHLSININHASGKPVIYNHYQLPIATHTIAEEYNNHAQFDELVQKYRAKSDAIFEAIQYEGTLSLQ